MLVAMGFGFASTHPTNYEMATYAFDAVKIRFIILTILIL